MATENLKGNQDHPDFKAFYDKLVGVDPDLKNFIQSSLLASENQGLIDRGYYDHDGISDEVYLAVYQDYDPDTPVEALRILLFRRALFKLDQLIRDEVNTPNEPSTGGMLKAELDRLDKKFIADVDGELIMQEELDDISYKQERSHLEQIYLDDHLIEQIVSRFDLDDKFTLAKERKIQLGILYSSVPSISRSIVELYVYGRQEQNTIVNILDVEDASVSRVLKIVQEKFRLI